MPPRWAGQRQGKFQATKDEGTATGHHGQLRVETPPCDELSPPEYQTAQPASRDILSAQQLNWQLATGDCPSRLLWPQVPSLDAQIGAQWSMNGVDAFGPAPSIVPFAAGSQVFVTGPLQFAQDKGFRNSLDGLLSTMASTSRRRL